MVHPSYWSSWSGMPHYVYRRGPSRILWFAFGAIVATMWNSSDKEHARREWIHCRGTRQKPPAVAATPDEDPIVRSDVVYHDANAAATAKPEGARQRWERKWEWKYNWHKDREDRAAAQAPTQSQPPQQMQQVSQTTWPQQQPQPQALQQPQQTQPSQQWPWEASDDRLAELSKQASDTMVDVTEATLESVLSTAQALKVKLAEHRAEREKLHQIELEKQKEEARRNPPRLV